MKITNLTLNDLKKIDNNFNEDTLDIIVNNNFKYDNNINNNVLISFIIASYNRYEMINKAIKSILYQNFKNIEIIVINDNSSDERYDLLSENYNIKYIKNKSSKGPGISRKIGYLNSTGKYIVYIDDDDFYIVDNFLEKGIKKLEEYSDLSFVSFNSLVFYDNSNELIEDKLHINGYIKKEDYFFKFMKEYKKPKSTFTTIFKKEKLEQASFNTMDMMNDSSIYLRSLTVGDAFIFNECIGIYLIHSSNISKSLSYDFIIENIKEKININSFLKTTNDNWIQTQVLETFSYFIIDSKASLKDCIKFINYVSKNTNINKILLYFNYVKFFILKLILSFKRNKI